MQNCKLNSNEIAYTSQILYLIAVQHCQLLSMESRNNNLSKLIVQIISAACILSIGVKMQTTKTTLNDLFLTSIM